MFYALAEDVILRREWFGGLAFLPFWPGSFHQFNPDAYQILRRLSRPISVCELVRDLRVAGYDLEEQDISEFLGQLVGLGLVAESLPTGSARNVHHDNRAHFRNDCLVAPTSTTIYITERCTKRCRHCVVRSSPTADTRNELGVSDWGRAFARLADFGVCALVVTGGEPLLKCSIFEILQTADQLGLGITLLTDYDQMDIEHINFLRSLKHLLDLQVSLDGSCRETHEFLRGNGSFARAIRRLELLRDSGIHYTISFTAHRGNVHEIDGVVDAYSEYGATCLYINPLAPYGRARDELGEYLLDDTELRRLARKYVDVIRERNVDSGNPYWQQAALLPDDPNFHPFDGALTAVSIGTYNLSIDCRGNCHLDSKMKSEGMYLLGNILGDDMESIWYNPTIDPLRRHYSPDEFTYIDQSTV